MINKNCLIYNFAQHYRTNIFKLMDETSKFDFVFGDKMDDVKKMDYSILANFKKEVVNRSFFNKSFYYQTEVLSLLNEGYTSYLMLGEIACVSTWLMLLLSKIKNKKVYLWTHGWYGKESLIKRILKKVYFSMAEGVFLYGNYARELMINEGIKDEKLHVIYNSLAYDKHLEIRQTLVSDDIYEKHFGNTHPNLIFVGRLIQTKRLDIVLMSIAKLKIQSEYYNFTIIGAGEMESVLFELTKELGLEDNVWFYGACYDEIKLARLIYNADLCVSPGNVGLTAIHSMTFGTPVLTHNNFPYQGPEFEAIEDGITGVFFEYENVDSFIVTIENWFQKCSNREMIRLACYEIIDSKYNPHVQLETIMKYLD